MMTDSFYSLLGKAMDSAEAGDAATAKKYLKAVLDRDFTNGLAWETLYRVSGQQRSFADFQHTVTQKYYPANLDLVPFCPKCGSRWPSGARSCAKCGFGAVKTTPNSVPQQASPVTATKQKTFTPLVISVVLALMVGSSFSGAGTNAGGFFILSLWAVPGYVGGVWLIKRGYMAELLGCMFIVGGAPLWIPAVLGPLLLGMAYWLPYYPQVRVASTT